MQHRGGGGGLEGANLPQRLPGLASGEVVDIGYDTDMIAIFDIDKAFTDYLLCQICFSKSTIFLIGTQNS